MRHNRLLCAFLIVFLVLAAMALPVAAGVVTKSVTAENTWTDPVRPGHAGRMYLTITGTFSATVTLQATTAQTNGVPVWTNAVEIETFTAPGRHLIEDHDQSAVWYRAGVATGDYTSGTVNLRLSE